jgi:hypothetical protein
MTERNIVIYCLKLQNRYLVILGLTGRYLEILVAARTESGGMRLDKNA